MSQFQCNKIEKLFVDILLQNNATVNAKSAYGETALIMAAKNGHDEIVKILLQNNADVKVKTVYDETALKECGESGEGASVNANRILRNWGCNMDRWPQARGLYCTPNFEE